VAGEDLIASYARELSTCLGGRAAAIAAETVDHLLESVDERVRTGVDRAEAERDAIAAFGAPSEVAASYVAAGVGIPTGFTRAAGFAGLVAAGLVTGGLVVILFANIAEWSQPWDGLPRTLWSIGILAVVSGVLLSAVGAAGLLRRQGLGSWLAVVLLGVAGVTAVAAWFVWLWLTALAMGAWIVTARSRRADFAPRRAVLRIGFGALLAAAVPWMVMVSRMAGASILDTDLLQEVLVQVSIALGLVIWASGVGVLGWRLFREGADEASSRLPLTMV
jgi:hypothetical protein